MYPNTNYVYTDIKNGVVNTQNTELKIERLVTITNTQF